MKKYHSMALSDCEWRTCSRSQHSNCFRGRSNAYSMR